MVNREPASVFMVHVRKLAVVIRELTSAIIVHVR